MGTNVGELEDNLLFAAAWLEDAPGLELVGLSPVYRTAPLGPALHPFLNAASLVRTDLSPETLMERLQECERAAGRPADHEKWGPRVLDLDLLVMGDRVRAGAPPLLPHPGLLERDFALRPLVDLDGDARDPVTGTPLSEILDRLETRTILSGPHALPRAVDYGILEHTADAGIEVRASSVEELMATAAMSLADMVAGRENLRERERIESVLEAPDEETLLVDLLQEVVFLLETRGFLPVRVRVRRVPRSEGPRIEASLFGSSVEPSGVRMAVKAATHHDLVLTREPGGHVRARVYLDV